MHISLRRLSMNLLLAFLLFFHTGCSHAQSVIVSDNPIVMPADVQVGAQRTKMYLPLLKGKRVAVLANQTSLIGHTNLVDSLLAMGVDVKKVFCPEHGFRGTHDAGADVKSHKDKKTGLPIISLYGKNDKPKAADLKNVDIVIYDLQDVGVRFYTYISTLHYMMEACAENHKELMIFDRPDPNGYYIDGPVLDPKYKSFVGMDPIPLVYAMTPAEYARMLNGEGWLKNGEKCKLVCIPVKGYTHEDLYQLPVKPSPNLPNMSAVYLYPSLALFEGTAISVGRGTSAPYEMIGAPGLKKAKFTFVPKSIPGEALHPKYENKKCYGYDLRTFGTVFMKNYQHLYLYWLINIYKEYPRKDKFFNNYFNSLAGNGVLKEQIMKGESEKQIRASWQPQLNKFKTIRKKYLLYKDFNKGAGI